MIVNTKKVISIEEVQELILTELCKSYMAGHQKLEISWTLMPKAIEFLGKLYVNIERLLPVTFSGL